MTDESLPIEYSITGLAAVAATSRKISIDSDSSSEKVPSIIVQKFNSSCQLRSVRGRPRCRRNRLPTVLLNRQFPTAELLTAWQRALRSRYAMRKRQLRQSGIPSWHAPVLYLA